MINQASASYSHQPIIPHLHFHSTQSIQFPKLNPPLLHPSKTRINPYYLPFNIFQHIQHPYHNPSQQLKKPPL
ncbi:SpoVR family protein, partial [Bacillus sp. WP8]|uniref:SpoVR family protein n=1 Tax=Bacillus sp. WP8 TaxID=756828 RepID=UPI0037C0539D